MAQAFLQQRRAMLLKNAVYRPGSYARYRADGAGLHTAVDDSPRLYGARNLRDG
jgi:hypothetical protein